jgi:hypothetical protein
VNGTSAHKYMVRNGQPKQMEMMLWIDEVRRPLQLAKRMALGNVTIRYWAFNDPTLLIEVPK